MKKFKVRIKWYHGKRYIIQYANYRFIPIWKTLHKYIHLRHGSALNCWNPVLEYVNEAEKLATSFKTIEDINEHYRKEKAKCQKLQEEEKAYLKTVIPFSEKEIK